MCGGEDPILAAKKIPLCGGRNKGVTKYECSFNPRFHGKITSL